jgi:hypothetical protein
MTLSDVNQSARRKNCASATLSITNPTWTDLRNETEPPRRQAGDDRPAANRLGNGLAGKC